MTRDHENSGYDRWSNSARSSSSENDARSDKVYLRRQIGVTDSVAMTVGVIIGSGIFISPSGILRFTGSIGWSLVVWVFCGVLSTLGALSFAELATTFPVSGGAYSYVLQNYGPLLAFVKLFNEIVASSTGGVTVLSIAFANYVLLPFYEDCNEAFRTTRLIAAIVLCFSTVVNSFSVPFARYLNIFFVVCKVGGLVVIIGFGIATFVNGGRTSNFDNPFGGDVSFTTFPLAVYSGLFAYSGWQNLFSVTEEIIRPSRTIPLSIIISMSLVTVVYMLANIAYMLVLSQDELLTSDAIALDLGHHVMGSWWWTMSLLVALSIAGSLIGVSLARARLFYVASREGHIPEIASMIHVDRKTPLPATALTVPISLMLLVSDDVYSLINYVGATGWFFSAITVAIIPYSRWRQPELKRPFKLPVVIPVLFSLCSLFVVGMSLYSSPVDCGIGVAITLTGVPVYYVTVRWRNKPRWVNEALDKMTIFLQQLMYVVPHEEVTEVADHNKRPVPISDHRRTEQTTYRDQYPSVTIDGRSRPLIETSTHQGPVTDRTDH